MSEPLDVKAIRARCDAANSYYTDLDVCLDVIEQMADALEHCEKHFAWKTGETTEVPIFSSREPHALLSISRAALALVKR